MRLSMCTEACNLMQPGKLRQVVGSLYVPLLSVIIPVIRSAAFFCTRLFVYVNMALLDEQLEQVKRDSGIRH